MGHPFGDLVSRHLHCKHGYSQARLAEGILQDPSIVAKMCKGERLSGPQARARVLAMIDWLQGQDLLAAQGEANALLAAAGMSSLHVDVSDERVLLQRLLPDSTNGVPRPAAAARQTNLPATLTSFVGRTAELAAIRKAVTVHRLVTLTGAGGVGKTRLAVEAGIRVVQNGGARDFADGVWLVELAALAEGAFLAQTISQQFKLPENNTRDPLEQLRDYLAPKRLLLILDNCEHLADPAASLATYLLQQCWQLHILATSREELRVPGEVCLPVLPLSLPDAQERRAEHVLASAAAQLFLERMSPAGTHLQPSADEVLALVQICRQLDGMPLALELAAPLTRSMTLGDIAGQLHDQMAILANSYRTVIPRHQTMHRALVWSYRLLGPAEKLVLDRASVFAGGWTIEAALAVCAGDRPVDILGALQQLTAKSWVLAETHGSRRRYRLLEPVRQFAQFHLAASGEQEAVRRSHALYYSALADHLEQARDTLAEREWLDKLELERDNLRAVNTWALEHDEAEFAHRFNGSLFALVYRSSAAEARRWLDAALALKAAVPTPTSRRAEAAALNLAGYVAIFLGDYEHAQTCFERELSLYQENGDQRGLAGALRGCGFTAMQRGELEQAQDYTDQSLAVAEAAEDRSGAAWSLFDLGYLAMVRDQFDQAETRLAAAVAALREQGIQFGLYRAMFALAQVRARRGDREQARGLFHEALRLQQEMHYSQCDCLESFAGFVACEGRPVRAARLFGAALAEREVTGMSRWRHRNKWYEHDVAFARSQLDPAVWEAGWAAGAALTLEEAVAEALAG